MLFRSHHERAHRRLELVVGVGLEHELDRAAEPAAELTAKEREEEIKRITLGPDAPGWTPFEATLLRTVDEMHNDAFISDQTWAELSAGYSLEQIMDFIMLMSRYWMVSTMLNSLGVQLEEGKVGLPQEMRP